MGRPGGRAFTLLPRLPVLPAIEPVLTWLRFGVCLPFWLLWFVLLLAAEAVANAVAPRKARKHLAVSGDGKYWCAVDSEWKHMPPQGVEWKRGKWVPRVPLVAMECEAKHWLAERGRLIA